MTSAGIETNSAEAGLEEINYSAEILQESFKQASLDRATTRGREVLPIPPLNFWEKLLVHSLVAEALVVTAGIGYITWRTYEQSPFWLLLPAGFIALYLAGGYDHWRDTRQK